MHPIRELVNWARTDRDTWLTACSSPVQPFRHTGSPCIESLNPPFQQPAAITHSYHDPDLPPPRRRDHLGTAHDSSEQTETTGFLFPNVLPFLTPGRRGAWLIPLSGPLPWAEGKPTPPSWSILPPESAGRSGGGPSPLRSTSRALTSSATLPTSPAVNLPASTAVSTSSGARRPRSIDWTDARLRAAWFWIDRLHHTGKVGPVWAECLTAAQSGGGMPDHIRVHAMAHLALALRQMIGLWDVQSLRWKGDGAETDGFRFLKPVRLVWVDEGGRPVMVA